MIYPKNRKRKSGRYREKINALDYFLARKTALSRRTHILLPVFLGDYLGTY